MACLTHYAEKKILDLLFRAQAFTAVTPYMALFTAAPTDNTAGTEVSGNGYARVAITCSAATDNGASAGSVITTSTNTLFPAQTPAVYVPVAWGILDAATLGTGNLIAWGAYSFPTPYNVGDQVQVPAGSFTPSAD